MIDHIDGEEWRPIQGFDGKYLISSLGRVYSVPRRHAPRGGLLKTRMNERGYLVVGLRVTGSRNTKTARMIHRLLAEAFLTGPRDGDLVRHLNDVKTDNRLSNLAWGTKFDNGHDAVRNRRHWNSAKTHCKWGHEFTPENTRIYTRGSFRRECLACRKRSKAKYRNRVGATS